MKLASKNEELAKVIHDASYDKCYAIAKKGTSKAERSLAFSEVKEEVKSSFSEEEIEEIRKTNWRILQQVSKKKLFVNSR